MGGSALGREKPSGRQTIKCGPRRAAYMEKILLSAPPLALLHSHSGRDFPINFSSTCLPKQRIKQRFVRWSGWWLVARCSYLSLSARSSFVFIIGRKLLALFPCILSSCGDGRGGGRSGGGGGDDAGGVVCVRRQKERRHNDGWRTAAGRRESVSEQL